MRSHQHAFCLILIITTVCSPAAQSAQERPPNIIFILADDAGYGDVGCYGGTHLPTPHLDRMAAQGMRFTRHYAGNTVCAPSRCVLLTGKHTGHCRVRGNTEGRLTDDDVTIGGVLQQAGYHTACIGKWGVGAPLPLTDPNDHGFDQFFGYVSMWHAHNFYPEFLIRNGQKEALRNISQPQWKGQDGRGVAEVRLDYAPDLLTEEVLKYLRRKHSQPFFLYYALNIPHTNNEGGRHNPGPEKGMEVPNFGPYADKDWPAPEKGFAAMMHFLDRDVGRILETLEQQGLDENTIVIFSSDNGPHQEGGHTMEFFNSNGPLRGMKRDLYEGGIRVPLIVRWPGRVAQGAVSHHISGFQDWLPTLAEIAGVKTLPSNIDGLSMLKELTGQPGQPQHEYLYWEFSEQKGRQAVMQGDWKLLRQQVSTTTPAPFELYNVAEDISESNDVAQRFPDKVKQLRTLLEAAHEPSPEYPLFPSERGPSPQR